MQCHPQQIARRLRVVPLLILCVLASGCVGFNVTTTKTQSFEHPELGDRAYPHALRSTAAWGSNAPTYTSAWLESHWGRPKAIRPAAAPESGEVWIYSFDLNWNGAILFVLLPIPLEVPVGRERVELLVRDGRVVSGKQRFMHTTGGVLGEWVGPCGLTGFGIHSVNE